MRNAWIVALAMLWAPAALAAPKTLQLDLGGGAKLDCVLVPAGEFLMGSPDGEKEGQACERPVRKVKITRAFYMGKFEVTNAQYRAFRAGHHSEYLDGDDQPALWVSWHDADAFCRWLSKKAGKAVRLPTEAEWEYACRAGTTTRFHTGDQARLKDSGPLSKAGWYGANTRGVSKPVGQKAPNAFGLYDMHGNAWEWCGDWYAADYYAGAPAADPPGPSTGKAKVLRGGSYRFWTTYYCRSAHRYSYRPDARECVTGFRVVVDSGKSAKRAAPLVRQPWPAARRIAGPDRPANDREVRVARDFGSPAVSVPTTAAPIIDGKLDDAVWSKARPLAFRHTNGRAGVPAVPTTARVLCDGKALYFAFDCADDDMARLRVVGSGRDSAVARGDAVGVLIDPGHTQTVDDCYNIAVNPAGVTRETRGYDGVWHARRYGMALGGRADKGPLFTTRPWDPKLTVATSRHAVGWRVELALPLVELGLKPGQVPTVIGLNLIRSRPEITSRPRGKPKLGTLVPHAWPTDDPDTYRPGENTGWATTLSPYQHLPIRFGHAALAAGTKKVAPPPRLFELIAKEDFADGTRGKFTNGAVEKGGYMGAGNALRFPQKDGATMLRAPMKDFRDVQILATVKADGGQVVYWHSFGKMWGSNKCCARQVTTLCRDPLPLDPSFTYCDGAGRMKATSEGLADRYHAGFGKHLSWYGEPTVGRVYFAGPKHWAVAYTRVGEMITQNPHVRHVYPAADELPGWFFHPAGRYDILISDAVIFRGVDNEPPARPTGVAAKLDGKSVALSWKPAKDNTLTVWYKVTGTRGGKAALALESGALSARVDAAKAKGMTFTVQAVDFFENFSAPSAPVGL